MEKDCLAILLFALLARLFAFGLPIVIISSFSEARLFMTSLAEFLAVVDVPSS
jgi:hypothetical protein